MANQILGQGDVTTPFAWQDADGNIPPSQFSAVPENLNYPLNGDGRYWWQVNANNAGAGTITFIGDSALLTEGEVEVALTWQICQYSTDGSTPAIKYSTNGGVDYQTVPLSQALQSGLLIVDMTGATGLKVEVISQGGTPSGSAELFEVAVAITRNVGQGPVYSQTDPIIPENYNPDAYDFPGYQTLSELRTRIITRLGFAAQLDDPPVGLPNLVNEFLTSAQNLLYWRYPALQTRRLFRWKLVPGQRFYSLLDNDDDVSSGFLLNPNKTIEWAGMQDNRCVWYPMIEGIPPELYTMLPKPWRPARFEIRSALEVYPAPDQTYWMWLKGHMGLLPFSADDNQTTIDSELVYLWALARAKGHYSQGDAEKIEQDANIMLAVLIAASHGTKRYIPGATPVPPAVRPTMISYIDGSGGQ